MRALYLIPGDGVSQLQALPAVAATASQLGFAMQVACPAAAAPVWSLLPAVEKTIPFPFGAASLADWANLLGAVRDPDFQACINLAGGPQVDLMLSMSHIPTRVAAGGFSATTKVQPPQQGWPGQRLAAYLRPIGVNLEAEAYRLPLPRAALDEATAAQPAGQGPLLLLAPSGEAADWPEPRWRELPGHIRPRLPDLRSSQIDPLPSLTGESLRSRAATVAVSDVVLSSDPLTVELALLCGVPVVALGLAPDQLPQRQGVTGLGLPHQLKELGSDDVLAALGLG